MGSTKNSPDGQELSTLERFRKVREELAQTNASRTGERREEDRIREEHHDAQAKTIQYQLLPKRERTSRKKTT
jgi:hypothetical protein